MDQEPATPVAPETPAKKTNWTLIIIIVVLLLLCLCCILPLVLYFWLGDIILDYFNNFLNAYGREIILLIG